MYCPYINFTLLRPAEVGWGPWFFPVRFPCFSWISCFSFYFSKTRNSRKTQGQHVFPRGSLSVPWGSRPLRHLLFDTFPVRDEKAEKTWKKHVFSKCYWYRDGSDDFWRLRALFFQTLANRKSLFFEKVQKCEKTWFFFATSSFSSFRGTLNFRGPRNRLPKKSQTAFFQHTFFCVELVFSFLKNTVFWD